MIILPTRGRRQRLETDFLAGYIKTGANEPVFVVIDDDDRRTYEDFPLPTHWRKLVYPRARCIEQVNRVFLDFPNEPYYAVMTDDVVPETPGWDKTLKNACLPHFVAWGNDGYWGYQVAGLPFIGGDLVRFLGWVLHPGFQHYFSDCVTAEIAMAAGLDRYHDDIITRHAHHTVRSGPSAPMDDTYRSHAPLLDSDSGRYWEMKRGYGLQNLAERVEARFSMKAAA